MSKRKKFALAILGVVCLGLLWIAESALRFDAYLPHQKIQIILPFDAKYDSVTTLIPMGETIYHPKPQVPNGHPGIDFVSQVSYPFIASAAGTITKIQYGTSSDGADITLNSGTYNIVYKEIDPAHMFVKAGQQVKQGDEIALPDPKPNPNDLHQVHYSTHWEFASVSPLRDRYCPLTYFTPDSLTRIEAIWARVTPTDFSNMKQHFPYICSGDYFNRTE